MADFYFNNAVDNSLDTLGNYWLDWEFTIPAGDFPQDADNVTASSVTISGGTATSTAPWQIGGSSTVSGGTFNGSVQFNAGFSQVSGGTYNGAVNIAGIIIVSGGTYNDDFTVISNFSDWSMNGSVVFNGRVSFDNQATSLFSPNSDAVADPSDVRDGVSNLGVEGTLEVSTPDYPSESDVRLGVDYDSANQTGTLDLPAESDVRSGVVYDNESQTGSLVSSTASLGSGEGFRS